MKETLEKMLSVKSIVTFALVGVTCYLAAASKLTISVEFFASMVTSVMTYFFTRATGEGK